MEQILLVIHLLIAIALVAVVLIQRSEGGGLGIGGGGGGMGGMMSVRSTANLLTRITAVLAACFMASSLGLAILAGAHDERPFIVDDLPPSTTEVPAEPAEPAVPLSE